MAFLSQNRGFFLLLLMIASLWFGFCSSVSRMRWHACDIGIDTAAWAQALENGRTGGSWSFTCYPDSPKLVSRNFYSIHFFHYFWPLSLIFRAYAHPLALFYLLHLAHALGAVFIGWLAFRQSGKDAGYALLVTLAFLFHPAHARAQTAYDFNPRHFSLLLMPLAVLAHTAGRYKLTLATLLILAAGEENLALGAAFLGWSLAINSPQSRKALGVLGIICCVYTIVVLKFGLPAFLDDGFRVHFASRFSHLWEGPGQWLSAFFRSDNLWYFATLSGPLLFVNMWRPRLLLIAAIPWIGQNFLSLESDTHLIGHHYTTPLAVLLFLGAVDALSDLSVRHRRGLAGVIVVLCAFLSIYSFPSLSYLWEGPDQRVIELGANISQAVSEIGPGESVSAPPAVCAQLWARPHLWFFPHGMSEAEWIVLPRYLPEYPRFTAEDLNRWVQTLLSDPQVTRIRENPDVILFRRAVTKNKPGP